MVLKLYGIYRSPWVRLVAAVLLEKQVEFELVPVNLANGEHKTPEYLAKHPFGQIPYIVCAYVHSICQWRVQLTRLYVDLGLD
jgi:glutathione S-transferase